MNPATAFAGVFTDELVRCGLAEAVIAPGSRSGPLAMALADLAGAAGPDSGRAALRLHVRTDERSAAFLALGLAKASGRPVVVLCTSGTAAASFHPAVAEADEAGVPLLVITADRPPELRGTGANQTIDQVKLYGDAVRWFCDTGVPQPRPGMAGYWRSVACRAFALASGQAGAFPGPVHVNVPLREPLVPEADDAAPWPEPLDGRPGGAPWTGFAAPGRRPAAAAGDTSVPGICELPWTERGIVVCGDGSYDAEPLHRLAWQASWPVLAEPSSAARHGPSALRAYPYLLASAEFAAGHVPDLIVSAGRPGLSRGQFALLRGAAGRPPPRHVVIAQGPGRWADPARTATDVAGGVALAGQGSGSTPWLESWLRADQAASSAADEVLDALPEPSEPRLARDLAAALPDGALLWAASSLPVRDLDQQMAPRKGLRVLANRGASGIDGLVSSAIGAALAHAAAGGGPAFALLGDLAVLHDLPGLMLGPAEARPDLCLIVVNNDGGGIFSMLEQAAFPASFERVFGTPHGTDFGQVARAAGVPYLLLERAAELPAALAGPGGRGPAAPRGLRMIEVRTSRPGQAALRERLSRACAAAAVQASRTLGSSTE